MPRYTISIHYLVKRHVAFIRDGLTSDESARWMWVMLRPETPDVVLKSNEPAVFLEWSEHAGHAETKMECYEAVVEKL